MKKVILFIFLTPIFKSFCQEQPKIDTAKLLIGWWVENGFTMIFRDSTMLTVFDTSAAVKGETFVAKWKYESGYLKITANTFRGPKTASYSILELSDNYLMYQLVDGKSKEPPFRGKKRK